MSDKRATEAALTLVSTSTVVEGKIRTDGSIRIDGTLIGDVVAKASAAVGLTGSVEGTVEARNVSLSGKLDGSVTALEKLVLEKKSVVKGDIRAARLVVDEGAVFDGTCVMSQPAGGSGGAAQH
jgi:cytoskeletal protein CcmA (bactofilin family)